jgi:hypothetical protein
MGAPPLRGATLETDLPRKDLGAYREDGERLGVSRIVPLPP